MNAAIEKQIKQDQLAAAERRAFHQANVDRGLEAAAALWAALATGDTRAVLRACRAACPDVFAQIDEFCTAVERGEYGTPTSQKVLVNFHELMDAMAEAAVATTKSTDLQHLLKARDALEKMTMTRLYPLVFGKSPGVKKAEAELEAKLVVARQQLTAARVGVTPSFTAADVAPTAMLLRRLHRYRAPQDKVALIVNACRLIERRLHEYSQQAAEAKTEARTAERAAAAKASALASSAAIAEAAAEPAAAAAASAEAAASAALTDAAPTDAELDAASNDAKHEDSAVGADEFFPCLVWVLLTGTPPNFASELDYIGRYRNPDCLRGVSGCYYTHMRAALTFLQNGSNGWGKQHDEPPPPAHETAAAASAALNPPQPRAAARSPRQEGPASGDGRQRAEARAPAKKLAGGSGASSAASEMFPLASGTAHALGLYSSRASREAADEDEERRARPAASRVRSDAGGDYRSYGGGGPPSAGGDYRGSGGGDYRGYGGGGHPGADYAGASPYDTEGARPSSERPRASWREWRDWLFNPLPDASDEALGPVPGSRPCAGSVFSSGDGGKASAAPVQITAPRAASAGCGDGDVHAAASTGCGDGDVRAYSAAASTGCGDGDVRARPSGGARDAEANDDDDVRRAAADGFARRVDPSLAQRAAQGDPSSRWNVLGGRRAENISGYEDVDADRYDARAAAEEQEQGEALPRAEMSTSQLMGLY